MWGGEPREGAKYNWTTISVGAQKTKMEMMKAVFINFQIRFLLG